MESSTIIVNAPPSSQKNSFLSKKVIISAIAILFLIGLFIISWSRLSKYIYNITSTQKNKSNKKISISNPPPFANQQDPRVLISKANLLFSSPTNKKISDILRLVQDEEDITKKYSYYKQVFSLGMTIYKKSHDTGQRIFLNEIREKVSLYPMYQKEDFALDI